MLTLFVMNARGDVVPEPDLHAWGRWMARADRVIATDACGPVTVKTIFLGYSLDFLAVQDLPRPFGTLVEGGCFHHYDTLHATRAGALRCHAERMAAVRAMHNRSVVRVSLRTAWRLRSATFGAWATDHLRGDLRIVKSAKHAMRLVGFEHEADAAVFMMSPWHVPPAG